MHKPGLPVLLAWLLLAGSLLAGAMSPACAQDPRDTERRLERTRAELQQIAAQRRKLEGERGAATRSLREADEKVAATSRELAELERRIAGSEAALADMQVRRGELLASLDSQRKALAALLRAAHALGEDAPLKLLLAQDRVADGQRLLAYHGYLQRERARRIEQLATELKGLAELETAIETERVALQEARSTQQTRLETLASERKARASTLAKLEGSYKDRAAREKALGRDVKSLESLLGKLREAAARAERERQAQARAAQERAARQGGTTPPPIAPAAALAPIAGGIKVGGLGWPVVGTLLAGYGAKMPDGRRSDGVLIAADAGAQVTAAAAGQVVFADWMNGYGLILIVDHGDDTMSLYAHNESLLRNVGDAVSRGDPVGRVGSSGGQGRPALYFELRRQGDPVDPRSWLEQR